MHNESPRSARSPKAVTFLRIPVLLAVGMMTMGSGMGNPGCGSSSSGDDDSPFVCEGGCAIAGTYTVQFADTSPPDAACEKMGLGLPTGPLMLSLSGIRARGTFAGAELEANYTGGASRGLDLLGTRQVTATTAYSVRMNSTVAAPAPESSTDRSVIEGTFELNGSTSDDGGSTCKIQRNFTATR
ncbi:hypothetical protein D7Y27_24615 [Corallococcus sp. AB004]|uniref:hypothetical protein n=1 Tax=Corallococcus TaxID=83461 RepID=UPI000EA25ABE|nr:MULTISPECIES: hypothetical protein [Corallococcus]RKI37970.1 hypothetical protein D7Y27_24615 [Corallococcus sp. AB004]NPC69146.1 hypothetical protein [Corallococcus exiguus]NPD27340.1 hypothetical protein [Corallococcus exiguus]NRD47843.1 hypothetical protein [Corallococcus exiguus]RKI00367.1 hypothetical protein D7Y04_18345 [Corallococcus sp. AB038B]